ncbi:MAG: urease accessory protein [Hyphomicrobiales bacterium]|nr:MAG: urease accessory protein [Hyphomicrobiales bacterium]
MNTAPVLTPNMQRSRGHGRLSVRQLDGRTRLDRLFQEGCAKIRIPKTYHGSALEAVMINTSGGLTGGDHMRWEFEAGAGTHLMLTTQACEKVYKASAGVAQTDVTLIAGPKSRLSWVPQETILFNRCAFARSIEADIAEDAEALFLEPMIFGRRSMGEVVTSAQIHDRWRIRQAGQLIHGEEFRMGPNVHELLQQSAVANGAAAMATLLFISPRAEGFLERARELIGPNGGVSHWNGKLLARVLAVDGFTLRKTLLPLVQLMNFEAALPKVWSL